MRNCRICLPGFFALLLAFSGNLANAYDYPFKDPYVATIVATPPEFEPPLPAEVPVVNDNIVMFPDRVVPEVFWHQKELHYSYLQQKKAAPLIFLVAGTGASYQSAKMLAMQKAFYTAGYHVVSISSPTHPNFIVAASTSGVPGNLIEDSRDIYSVMEAIWLKLQKNKMEVTSFNLTGYSLGATQSAFIAKLDEEKQVFNFRRVLLINPAVSLYNSVTRLDGMLENNLPGGVNNFHTFYQQAIAAFADVYKNNLHVQFNEDFLYEAYKYRKPKVDENLEVMIGASFRMSSQNMVFATDVMTQAGYVVPKGQRLGEYEDYSIYAKVLGRLSFVDYFNGVFVPHFQKGNPALTAEELIQEMSLTSIEPYLRSSMKIGLMGNQDDIILAPGEIDFLRNVFGSRATIYPYGGHCGNMNFPENVYTMLNFFATPVAAPATATIQPATTADSAAQMFAGAN
jgi:hypothetical protein